MSVKKRSREESSQTKSVVEGMAIWGSYYRENIDIFIKEYLGIDYLKWFQYALLAMMASSRTFVLIASRGMGKTFLTALFVVSYAILYPSSKIVITSGKRSQSIAVLEKIQSELMPNSPNLRNEIDLKKSKFSGQDAMVLFRNSSYIKVVTAADSARSNRATILVVDEFRMVVKELIDTVFRKFLTSRRMPPYRALTEEERTVEYAKEPNKSLFLSSAFFKDHWSYGKMTDTFKSMLITGRDFVCALPYQLSIQEGLLFAEDVEGEMLEEDFSEIRWKMEMEALWFGDEEGAFFDFSSVSKNRKLEYPMLPERLSEKLGNDKRLKIPPKKEGELRVISADIALMTSKKHDNDASAIFINQLLLTKSGRYSSNIIYGDGAEGLLTDAQALMIRRLYEEYECDYMVLDCAGLGLGVYDCFMRDMADPDSGEIYPALSCCNNPEMASRCTVAGADKTIWAIKGSQVFNSDCAILLREAFRSGKIRLLMTEYDGESLLSEIKGYSSLSSSERLSLQMPYIHTTLLVDELVKLQHEESGGRIRVYEKSTERKDRYSSLSYNYYVVTQLESKIRKRKDVDVNTISSFAIRPPKSFLKRRGKRGL